MKTRKDKGQSHDRWEHGGKHVLMYNLAGTFEEEFDDLQDAVARNNVGATYQGILACCQKTIRKHKKKIWRWKDEPFGSDTLSDLI